MPPAKKLFGTQEFCDATRRLLERLKGCDVSPDDKLFALNQMSSEWGDAYTDIYREVQDLARKKREARRLSRTHH